MIQIQYDMEKRENENGEQKEDGEDRMSVSGSSNDSIPDCCGQSGICRRSGICRNHADQQQ